MRVWLTKGLGSIRAADDESAAVLAKIPAGTTFEADVKTRKPRSGAWHRRYFALCQLIYANVEGFKSVREVHEYLKLEAGLVRTIALRSTGELVRIPTPSRSMRWMWKHGPSTGSASSMSCTSTSCPPSKSQRSRTKLHSLRVRTMTEATALSALRALIDVMRRSDPDYVQSHGCAPCVDDEWDYALEQAEDVIEESET